MDIYKKKLLSNLILLAIFIIAIVLQFVGQATAGYPGLAIQAVSLIMAIGVLWAYNRRYV